MYYPFCEITKVECVMVGKDDPCPLTEQDLWSVMDHNGFCEHQVAEDLDPHDDCDQRCSLVATELECMECTRDTSR